MQTVLPAYFLPPKVYSTVADMKPAKPRDDAQRLKSVPATGQPTAGVKTAKPRDDAQHPESVAAIGQRIRQTREAMRLNQSAFARLVGTEPQAVNNWESARSRISLDQAINVCKATGASLDWIYRGLASSGLPVNLATALQTLDRAERKR
jgi:DNA-binding transcriptional regulator YiaG